MPAQVPGSTCTSIIAQDYKVQRQRRRNGRPKSRIRDGKLSTLDELIQLLAATITT